MHSAGDHHSFNHVNVAVSYQHTYRKSKHTYTVLTTSTEIILETRKCGPCQERVFICFKLQEAIEAVKPIAGMRIGFFQKEEFLSNKRKPLIPPSKCTRFEHIGSNLKQFISANFGQKRGNTLKRGRFSSLQ